ncbi:transferrin-binding protein-like solute binding protein [Neisseria weaveri]|uniref:transferrin-binding protein-like solute binding protein n=1 Tax=Neisseria weaveri TaxID=28091 RepID=UPI000D30BBC0|nr:transferrin-binding protein-like solute binding protein [Neisseria weaveri]
MFGTHKKFNAKVKYIAGAAVCAALLSACGSGGASLEDDLKHYVEFQSVIKSIQELKPADELTVADEGRIKTAFQNYQKLSEQDKKSVPSDNVEKLKNALLTIQGNKQAASTVDKIIAQLPSANQIDTADERQQLFQALRQYNALTVAQKTWLSPSTGKTVESFSGAFVLDNDSLPSLNLPTPKHTAFISSATAQQQNPHMQQRMVDGKVALLSNQPRLIQSLDIVKNDSVIVDGVILNNSPKEPGNPTTDVQYLTTYSAITKAKSVGNSGEDISALLGKDKGVYSISKTSFDEETVNVHKEVKEAMDILGKKDASEEELIGAKKIILKYRPLYTDNFDYPVVLDWGKLVIKKLPSQQKDFPKNALLELKKVYFAEYDESQKIADAYNDLLQDEANSAAWEVIKKHKPLFTDHIMRRVVLDAYENITAEETPYIRKDKNGLVFDPSHFDGIYSLKFEDGTHIVLHDSAAAGWHYQTFAYYTDPKNGVIYGYQSVGDETPKDAVPDKGTATYSGITTARLTDNGAMKHLTARVNAVADFAKKAISFTTSDAHTHRINDQGFRESQSLEKYNLYGHATWEASSNSFKGDVFSTDKSLKGELNGKFYGASVAEIGGTYGLKDQAGKIQLIGGYGAARK